MMRLNPDCSAWEGLNFHRKHYESASMFPQLDEIDRKLDQVAREISADQRRLDAIARDCPDTHAQVLARIAQVDGSVGADSSSADLLLRNADELARQLETLDDKQLDAVERAVATERARRKG